MKWVGFDCSHCFTSHLCEHAYLKERGFSTTIRHHRKRKLWAADSNLSVPSLIEILAPKFSSLTNYSNNRLLNQIENNFIIFIQVKGF